MQQLKRGRLRGGRSHAANQIALCLLSAFYLTGLLMKGWYLTALIGVLLGTVIGAGLGIYSLYQSRRALQQVADDEQRPA